MGSTSIELRPTPGKPVRMTITETQELVHDQYPELGVYTLTPGPYCCENPPETGQEWWVPVALMSFQKARDEVRWLMDDTHWYFPRYVGKVKATLDVEHEYPCGEIDDEDHPLDGYRPPCVFEDVLCWHFVETERKRPRS